jgi:hypothetical protein
MREIADVHRGAGVIPQGSAMSHVRMATSSGCGSNCCPALPGGTGILPDGDFSQANNWGRGWFMWKKHYMPKKRELHD